MLKVKNEDTKHCQFQLCGIFAINFQQILLIIVTFIISFNFAIEKLVCE